MPETPEVWIALVFVSELAPGIVEAYDSLAGAQRRIEGTDPRSRIAGPFGTVEGACDALTHASESIRSGR